MAFAISRSRFFITESTYIVFTPVLLGSHVFVKGIGKGTMNGYVGITDMWGLLRNDQLKYFDVVFAKVQRKLSLREFAIVMRAMERGIHARRIAEMLFAGAPTVH